VDKLKQGYGNAELLGSMIITVARLIMDRVTVRLIHHQVYANSFFKVSGRGLSRRGILVRLVEEHACLVHKHKYAFNAVRTRAGKDCKRLDRN
jgi:hypothetical protein